MPLMSPFSSLPKTADSGSINLNTVDEKTQVNAAEVLKSAGIDQRRGKSRMAPLLCAEGLGLEELARKLNNFASYSDDESIQFQAAKLALQLHGELDKDGADKNAGVQINFVGVTPELLQVLIPRS